ncbi:response regulator transcription factor [Peptoniphilus sp. KCTC 25270]|uniref:response regulator transcription factor n=1 Tax=Peptoniphilus sp. KCTC 25270 TaxID=2897414 RepID=UPI001E50BB1C|nr:response regulator transcription factor [Peptoniphilus sp. KCTC 25270]MCD1147317.1 response regulator transcription factor [Peptoniphilus sp. KCTC 25270]
MENRKWKIFLVEDDPIIGEEIEKYMVGWGYHVKRGRDFQNIFGEFQDYQPDLVLMDVTLPFFNGYHWCQLIRSHSKLPILFLSAADENLNLIMAMNLGADDYLTKPFELEVLQAKVAALLRRSYEYVEVFKDLYYKNVTLKRDSMMISYGLEERELTKNEFRILEMLLEKPGTIFPREEIMERIWQSDDYIDDNTLTVNIMRLRKKLEEMGLRDWIQTKKGVGYYVPSIVD